MPVVHHLKLEIAGRTVEFDMELDPGFAQDRALLFCMRQFGSCEPEVEAVMARVLEEGDVAVDAGAAVGFFTLLMAKLVGEDGTVLAIEPGANNLSKLRENIRINALQDYVFVTEDPLWSCAIQKPFFMTQDSGYNSLVMFDQQVLSQTVRPTTTLSKVIGARKPKLLKIDCEGAEFEIIRDDRVMTDLNYQIPYVIMELNEGALKAAGSSPDEVRKRMRQHGYEMFALHRDGSLPTYLAPTSNLRYGKPNLNVLFSTMGEVLKAWPEIQL